MAGRRLGDRVIVMGVREPRAPPHQAPEPASQLRTEALEIVAAKLVDGDQHDQGRSFRWYWELRRQHRRLAKRDGRERKPNASSDHVWQCAARLGARQADRRHGAKHG